MHEEQFYQSQAGNRRVYDKISREAGRAVDPLQMHSVLRSLHAAVLVGRHDSN